MLFCYTCRSTAVIYTHSLHDALPISSGTRVRLLKGSEGVFRAGRFERVSEGGVFRRGFHRWIRDQQLGFLREIGRSEEHTSELQSRVDLVCRLLLEKKNK